MIGNDLVDLQQASRESNWMRAGFLHKLFTKNEQQYIMLANHPTEMVWLLWSMKEAVYKIYNRQSGVREFAPHKLSCTLRSLKFEEYYGQVQIAGSGYYTKTQVEHNDFIHTVAALTPYRLEGINTVLYPSSTSIDYKAMAPHCVSHHGRFLALIF